jgi:hypothetical protein
MAGCKKSTGTISDKDSKDNISPTIESKQTKDDITQAATEASAEDLIKKESSSKIPHAADFSSMKQRLSSLKEARNWGDALDLRQCDLTDLELTNDSNELSKLVFDTATKWPDKLPKGFDPETIMETGKNPGLGIRNLHAKGITGKGVNIAIVDYALLLDHEEYCDQVKFYGDVNSSDMMELHGPLVSSIAVGKTTGVAPNAGLYYVASNNVTTVDNKRVIDYTSYADAIYKVIRVNDSLPKDQKIRALSISADWCPDNKGYKEITEAIEKAKEDGIFVISCNLFETYGFWTYSLAKDSNSDPDDPASHKPFEWNKWISMVGNVDSFIPYYEKAFRNTFDGKMLLVPIGSRTVASATGKSDYCFYSDGGWSTMEPYLAGLYAMACQVKPDVTPELFWKTALETGDNREIEIKGKKYSACMLNPEKLIKKFQE